MTSVPSKRGSELPMNSQSSHATVRCLPPLSSGPLGYVLSQPCQSFAKHTTLPPLRDVVPPEILGVHQTRSASWESIMISNGETQEMPPTASSQSSGGMNSFPGVSRVELDDRKLSHPSNETSLHQNGGFKYHVSEHMLGRHDVTRYRQHLHSGSWPMREFSSAAPSDDLPNPRSISSAFPVVPHRQNSIPMLHATGLRCKYEGTRFLPGRGSFHVFEGGFIIPTHIDGQPVNPAWGLTKTLRPRKRLAVACLNCRIKKVRCDPGGERCVQCEKANRTCQLSPRVK